MHTRTHMHKCTHTYTYTNAHTHTHTQMHTHMHTCAHNTHMHTHIHPCTHTYTYTHTYTHAQMHTHMHTHIHKCTHTHTHSHFNVPYFCSTTPGSLGGHRSWTSTLSLLGYRGTPERVWWSQWWMMVSDNEGEGVGCGRRWVYERVWSQGSKLQLQWFTFFQVYRHPMWT